MLATPRHVRDDSDEVQGRTRLRRVAPKPHDLATKASISRNLSHCSHRIELLLTHLAPHLSSPSISHSVPSIPDLISYRSCHMSSRPLLFGSVLACIFILLWSGTQPACSTMAKDDGSVHIVYVQKSAEHADNVEDHHLSILEAVVGSREAAKEKLVYSYSQAMSGFSAKLTDDQVNALKETPGVLQVVKDQVHSIHAPRGVGGSGPRVTKIGGNVISSLGRGAGNLHGAGNLQ